MAGTAAAGTAFCGAISQEVAACRCAAVCGEAESWELGRRAREIGKRERA